MSLAKRQSTRCVCVCKCVCVCVCACVCMCMCAGWSIALDHPPTPQPCPWTTSSALVSGGFEQFQASSKYFLLHNKLGS